MRNSSCFMMFYSEQPGRDNLRQAKLMPAKGKYVYHYGFTSCGVTRMRSRSKWSRGNYRRKNGR